MRNKHKEYDELQKLKHENKKLKRQNAALIKQLNRIHHYKTLEELVEKQYNEDVDSHEQSKLAKLKDKWTCHTCKSGYLKIIIFNRLDGPFYYRRCSNMDCGNRTKMKKYHKNVEGIKG